MSDEYSKDETTPSPLAVALWDVLTFYRYPLVVLALSLLCSGSLWPRFADKLYFILLFSGFFSLIVTCLTVFFIVNASAYVYEMVAKTRPDSPIGALFRRFRALIPDRRTAVHAAVTILAFCLFAVSFSINKALIPHLNGFVWDDFFHRLDVFLFFGTAPAALFLDSPILSILIPPFELSYQAWYFAYIYSFCYIAAYCRGRNIARVFLLSSFIVWFFGGNVIATVLGSAGPIFPEITGIEYYTPLIDRVREANFLLPSFALGIREQLLFAYETVGFTSISAFPSMHVCSTFLVAFLFGRKSKGLFALFAIFAAMVFVSSVVLLWHYFVDSLFAVGLAFAAWSLSSYIYERKIWV